MGFGQDDVGEDLLRLQREVDHVAADLGDALGALAGHRLRDSARHHRHGVDPAPAEQLGDLVRLLAHADDLACELGTHGPDDAEDVAIGRRSVRSHDEVRASEREEVRSVVAGHERVVLQPSRELRGDRDLEPVDGVGCLGGRGVMRLGAHAADALSDQRQLLHGPSLEELLEAAKLRDDQEGRVDRARLVQVQVDAAVALEPRDGIDADPPHRPAPSRAPLGRAPPISDVGRLKQ